MPRGKQRAITDFAIRAAITNHRSRAADFDALVDAVLRLGRPVAGGE